MLTLILACTITTPCIYTDPNPTLPGITNMAGGPDIAKDMTHESENPLNKPRTTQSDATSHPSNTTSLIPPRTTPTPHASTQRRTITPPSNRAIQTYVVRSGDCLYTIALHHGTTWQTLWGLNHGIMDPNLIWPGEEITVP